MVPANPMPIPDPPRLALVESERAARTQCAAETAECTCPEFCERDHDRD